MEPIKIDWDDTQACIVIRLNQQGYCLMDYVVKDMSEFEWMLDNAAEFIMAKKTVDLKNGTLA